MASKKKPVGSGVPEAAPAIITSKTPRTIVPVSSKMVVINDDNYHKFVEDPTVDKERKARGLIPRLFSECPQGYLGAICEPFSLPLIPDSEIEDRIRQQEKDKSSLQHIREQGKDGGLIPSTDQNGRGYCFPAGTLIRMGDGSERRIEDVKVRDEVVTAEGNVRRVTQTMVRRVNEPLLTPVMWGHYHLRATAEHPILTKRGYVQLCELQPGDWVAFPKYAAKSANVLQTGDFLYDRNFVRQSRRVYRHQRPEVQSEYTVGLPGRTKATIRTSVLPDAIHLTHGFGRLAGLFLAEGHTDAGKVQWSFHLREKDTFAAEVVELARTEMAAEAKLVVRPNNVVQVTIYGVRWAKMFESLFSHGAGAKRVHPCLASGPLEFLHGMLTGWMDGDRQRGNSAVTISRELALNMFDIANAHGLLPIFSTHQKGKVGNDGILRQHAWKVGWGDSESAGLVGRGSYRATQDDTHMWRKVCEITSEPFEGDVFNLEVEGDHSYVAEGVGVHNCWAHGTCSAVMLVRAKNNQPFVSLSAYHVACIIKNYRDEGGWCTQALDFIAKRGIASEEFWPQRSVSKSNDTPQMWQNAALHKVEQWWDISDNRETAKRQMATLLLLNDPVQTDHNWWGHSICTMRLISWNPFKTMIWNSWGESWSDRGMGILEGSKAIPDGAVAPRVVTAATV